MDGLTGYGWKLDALLAKLKEGQQIIERCANCSWFYEGTFREGRAAFRAHVELEHPDLVVVMFEQTRKQIKPKLVRESEDATLVRLANIAAAA